MPFILSPELSESFVIFICSGATANNCRIHANSQSARLETASAKLLLGKYSVLSFSAKVILQANCCLSSLAVYFYIAGKSIFGGKHLIAIKSF